MQAAAVLLQVGAMEVLQTQKHSPRDHHDGGIPAATAKVLDASNLADELTLCAHARCSGSAIGVALAVCTMDVL